MSSPPERYAEFELTIDIASNFDKILDGLKTWQERGLIVNVDLRMRMLLPSANYVRVRVEVKPELLAGLDIWLGLGIVSHAEVFLFCSKELTCDYDAAIAPSRQEPKAFGTKSQIPSNSTDIPVPSDWEKWQLGESRSHIW
ncbi:MAG: hypothetical protein HC856_09190 [Pseudanabaena sp. RU_4_16]|nr:hypothetical protein [Pseudanabaena sp. RU_4_16]